MASVHQRKDRNAKPSGWEAKWRDPDTGRMRSKTFRRKGDAARHGVKMEAAKIDGVYVDPDGGRVTFKGYAERWRASQVHRKGTADQVRSNLIRHVYPRLGHRPLASIRPSEIQALVKALSVELAPATVGVIHSWVATVFKAAVADRLIPGTPCEGVKLPTVDRPRAVPLETDVVAALAAGIDARCRALIVVGAGTGVRISEGLGLTVDRVDFLRRQITIDRQLVRTPGPLPAFGPVKDRHNRSRTIPVGNVVLDALAAHIAEFGTGPEGLVFTSRLGGKVNHNTWSDTWRAVAAPLGISTGDGFHQLRHFYASTLIRAGCSVKEVQERLGHTSAAMTLDVYGHLWPSDDDRTRQATDVVLAELSSAACSHIVRTEER